MKFTKTTLESLGYYVYGLIDPSNKEIFYVGKASANNRAFDHLKETNSESKKHLKIKEIRLKGLEPEIEVLRYGLKSDDDAFQVEAAIIDTLGIENLTNKVRGHGIERGRLNLKDIERLHGSLPIKINEINEICIIFIVNKTFSPTQDKFNLYDCTRGCWGIGPEKRSQSRIALAVYDSVIIEVYKIEGWFKAGTTLSTRIYNQPKDKWEFVGKPIENHHLRGKKIVDTKEQIIKGIRKGFRYVN
jgi:hypothetical protein